MEAQAKKRLNLIDVIVLVAATAAGFALARAIMTKYGGPIEFSCDLVVVHVLSVAWTWTLAILALNLTRYFSTRRELASRPGFTAVVAVVVERASGAICYVIAAIMRNGLFETLMVSPSALILDLLDLILDLLEMNVMFVTTGGSPAGAVAAVWIVTALSGNWRPEKSWIDRTGRALGLFWLLATFAIWLIESAFPTTPVTPISVPISGA